MDRKSPANLTAIARDAYGTAAASNDPIQRSYAAGVEDLARYLLDEAPSETLRLLLADVAKREERAEREARIRQAQRPTRPRSVRVTQTLGDVAPGSTVIGYSGR